MGCFADLNEVEEVEEEEVKEEVKEEVEIGMFCRFE